MMQPNQEALIARRVGDVELGFHAHQHYLNSRGTPHTLNDLATHSLIGFDEETPFIRNARKTTPAWDRDAFSIRTIMTWHSPRCKIAFEALLQGLQDYIGE